MNQPDPTTASPGADQPSLRDRIADAIARVDAGSWGTETKAMHPYWQKVYRAYADAVLAVLPEPADRAAATCSAQYHGAEEVRQCIRVAQHTGEAHTDQNGFHWSDTVAVYPLADGTWRTGTDVRAELRRLAGEQTACPTACDSGCTADCHEVHTVPYKRGHQPEECGAPGKQPTQEAQPDTLPAWLYQRFDPRSPDWDSLSDDDRAYWEHHARAVRRAVARNGFKEA